ncbi:MAG: hypothetical protein KAJ19_29355, partial [Gammaproteobacteria bacterium]|nr:hypothetical protein [Gammaproteobacteria bacterium]
MDSISGKRHPSRRFASIVRCFVVALALMSLLTACLSITGRVHRKHDNYVHEKYKYLTGRTGSSSRHPVHTTLLSRREAEKDLDELEWL